MSDYVVDDKVRVNGEIYHIDEKSGAIDRHTVEWMDAPLGPVGGTKNDSDKPDLSLVPLAAIEQIAKALMYGERKYHRYNYLKGFNSNRLIAATLRHVLAWQNGEDLDPESGLSHLAHALAGLSMLLDCQRVGTLTDGRFKRGGE
jgi:hypothetical protein